MNQMQTFHFSAMPVRVVTGADGEPWWIAADVCAVLDLGNPTQALTRLDEEEQSTLISNEGGPGRRIINESGLYSLVLGSRKLEAKAFKKWITSEVLPSIRKTGAYNVNPFQAKIPQTFQEALRSLAAALDERDTLRTKVADQDAAISTLKPKADFADAVVRTKDLLSFREFAKILGTGQNIFVKWLRAEGYLIGKTTEPYQQFVNQGLFKVKELSFEDKNGLDRTAPKTLITGKGQRVLQQRYAAQSTRGLQKVSSL